MKNFKISLALLTACLCLALCVLPGAPAMAAESSAGMTVVASGSYSQSSESENGGGLLFLFSSGQIDGPQNGDVYLFFSKLEVSSTVTGNVYSLFSEVAANPGAEIKGRVVTLSSVVELRGVSAEVDQLISSLNFFRKLSSADGLSVYDDRFEHVGLWLSGIQIAMVYLAAAVKRSFVEQGAMLLYREPLRLIGNGIIAYFVIAALLVLLTATVFLFPVSILILLVFYAALVGGEASLALIIGHTIVESVNSYVNGIRRLPFHLPLSRTFSSFLASKKGRELKIGSTACILVGVLIIEGLRNIPYLSWGFSYLFFPIFALGSVYTALVNGFILKRYYSPIFYSGENRKTGSGVGTVAV